MIPITQRIIWDSQDPIIEGIKLMAVIPNPNGDNGELFLVWATFRNGNWFTWESDDPINKPLLWTELEIPIEY